MDDATPPGKACSTCGIVKQLDDFAPDKRRKDGRQARCRECHGAYQKRYRQEKREHYLQLRKQEHERRRPKILAYQKAYQEANRERIKETRKRYLESLTADELEELRVKRRVSSTAYRLENSEVCAERIRAWRKANRSKVAAAAHRRRLRKYGNGAHESFSRDEIGEQDGWICGICLAPIDQTLRWPDQWSASLDHVVPLALGGEHTRENSRIAHWICNVRRGVGRDRRPPKDAAA